MLIKYSEFIEVELKYHLDYSYFQSLKDLISSKPKKYILEYYKSKDCKSFFRKVKGEDEPESFINQKELLFHRDGIFISQEGKISYSEFQNKLSDSDFYFYKTIEFDQYRLNNFIGNKTAKFDLVLSVDGRKLRTPFPIFEVEGNCPKTLDNQIRVWFTSLYQKLEPLKQSKHEIEYL